mmetsp:Transcript_93489/g.147740  ORF Transcript_93489/g.147740 Transcript_93489/m.147740 type:complete len:82 (+) Transcript_93489:297-542(+)
MTDACNDTEASVATNHRNANDVDDADACFPSVHALESPRTKGSSRVLEVICVAFYPYKYRVRARSDQREPRLCWVDVVAEP